MVPWQPPSTIASVGSSSTAKSAASQSGLRAAQPQQPVALRLHLLAVVEHVGDVPGGRRDGRGQAQHDGDPALHVSRPEPAQGVTVPARRQVVGGRDGVEVPGQHHPLGATPRGPRHDGVAVPVDAEVPDAPQRRLDGVGQLGLVPALGVDVHQRGGERGCVLVDVESRHLGTVTR